MKINISTIENENGNALSEVKASAANAIVGGETTARFDWNSLTVGPTSGQALRVNRAYVLPNSTDLNFNWFGWS